MDIMDNLDQAAKICEDIVNKMGFHYTLDSPYCLQRLEKYGEEDPKTCDECEFNSGCALYASLYAAYSFAIRLPDEADSRKSLRTDWGIIKNLKTNEEFKQFCAEITETLMACRELPLDLAERAYLLQEICNEIT
jgi:hypothetical protein